MFKDLHEGVLEEFAERQAYGARDSISEEFGRRSGFGVIYTDEFRANAMKALRARRNANPELYADDIKRERERWARANEVRKAKRRAVKGAA